MCSVDDYCVCVCQYSSVNDHDDDGDKEEDGSSAKGMKMIPDNYLLEVST